MHPIVPDPPFARLFIVISPQSPRHHYNLEAPSRFQHQHVAFNRSRSVINLVGSRNMQMNWTKGYTLCLFFLTSVANAAGGRPNILFIMSDDHACNAISTYRGRLARVAPTPNIDRIARAGIRLDKCYVTNSICTPSRAVILSGQHSHVNGVRS